MDQKYRNIIQSGLWMLFVCNVCLIPSDFVGLSTFLRSGAGGTEEEVLEVADSELPEIQ